MDKSLEPLRDLLFECNTLLGRIQTLDAIIYREYYAFVSITGRNANEELITDEYTISSLYKDEMKVELSQSPFSNKDNSWAEWNDITRCYLVDVRNLLVKRVESIKKEMAEVAQQL